MIFRKLMVTPFFVPLFIALPVDQTADRIHAKTVKVIFLQPVICGRLKEAGQHNRQKYNVILSERSESKELGADLAANVDEVRSFFDSTSFRSE